MTGALQPTLARWSDQAVKHLFAKVETVHSSFYVHVSIEVVASLADQQRHLHVKTRDTIVTLQWQVQCVSHGRLRLQPVGVTTTCSQSTFA